MSAQPAPKLDFKMLVLPAVMFFSKKIDFKDPQIVQYVQIAFTTVLVLLMSVYLFAKQKIEAKKDTKKIWVPPKPKPQLPFGLGPAPEPVEPKDYEETTYMAYEQKLVQELIQSALMSAAISFFMSYQFKVHMSLLMQAIMMPLNAFDAVILKKVFLGVTKNADGGPLYNELFSAPTKESIAIAEKLAAARAAGVGSTTAAAATTEKEEPRVVELPDEPKEDKKNEEDKEEKKVPAKTAATEID